jgi:hypothetical protein
MAHTVADPGGYVEFYIADFLGILSGVHGIMESDRYSAEEFRV